MYVDALYNRKQNVINVVERVNGQRIYKTYPAEYVFYYHDPQGTFTSVYNDKLSQFKTNKITDFKKELSQYTGQQLFESDIRPIQRCLENEYSGAQYPKLNVLFFDIEVDFDQERGHSPTTDPFNMVTAISLYQQWNDKLITLAIPPKSLSVEDATEMVSGFPNTYILSDEVELLQVFLELISDADVLSGWNSEGYDIPYLVNRIKLKIGERWPQKFCLWNQFPKLREYERYGAEQITYDLVGRIHLDYMLLYMKYTYHEMHSYSLDAIGEYELNERKVAYQGTLDELYNNDFYTFIDYSRQDVDLLRKLDNKLKFIDLASAIAHDNTVLIPKTMGSVALTEQGIINEAHRRGYIIPDRCESKTEDTQAAGAYVAYPQKGLQQWIGSIDINSLYPSTIRALNMAPETLVGQLRPTMTTPYIKAQMSDVIKNNARDKMDKEVLNDLFEANTVNQNQKTSKGKSFAEAWEGLFGSLEYEAVMAKKTDAELYIDWQNGESTKHTAAEIYNTIFHESSTWCMSANGTIFSLERTGIIPGLLESWYSERKVLQKTKGKWIALKHGIELPEELADKLVNDGN